MKSIFLLLLISCAGLYAQKTELKKITDLNEDEQEMYALLKQSVFAYYEDSSDMHFFPTITLNEIDNEVRIKTSFYNTPVKKYDSDQRFRSATHYAQLSFKVIIPLSLISDTAAAGYDFAYPSTRATDEEGTTYRLLIYEKKHARSRLSPYGKQLLQLSSDTPFLERKYNYKVLFETGETNNQVDYDLYPFPDKKELKYLYCCKDYAIVKRGGVHYGVIANDNTEILPIERRQVLLYNQGMLVLGKKIAYFFDPIKKVKTSAEYDLIYPGFIYTSSPKLKNYSKVKKNNMWSILDSTHREIIPLVYSNISIFNTQENTATILAKKGNKSVLIDLETGKDLSAEYDSLFLMRNDFLLAENNNKFGFINPEGSIILDVNYDMIYSLDPSYTVFAVKQGDAYAFYDYESKSFTSDFIYSSIERKGGLFIVGQGKKIGAMNEKGEIIIPFDYKEIEYDRKAKTFNASKCFKKVSYLKTGEITK